MMSKLNDLFHLRFKQKESPAKMNALVERSNNGELSSFSGVFRVVQLSEQERADLETILRDYQPDETQFNDTDLRTLVAITSEVKAITNQAVILHGERIKRAQDILKRYKDGAFTAWLLSTYGNRQTPYNFLQYFEFYSVLPPTLHPKLDQMPRQAIYALASREGHFEKKEEIVKNYTGQAKHELLRLIRKEFPLDEGDKRLPQFTNNAITCLKKARDLLKSPYCEMTEDEKQRITNLLKQLSNLVK